MEDLFAFLILKVSYNQSLIKGKVEQRSKPSCLAISA